MNGFPFSYRSKIKKCLFEYNRSTVIEFKNAFNQIFQSESDVDIDNQDFDDHNKWLFEIMNKTQDIIVTSRALFLFYRQVISQFSNLFQQLNFISTKRHIDSLTIKSIKSINHIFQQYPEILHQYSKLFFTNKPKWIHFSVIGRLAPLIEVTQSAQIIHTFTDIIPTLTSTTFQHLKSFINGLSFGLFNDYLKPFLDQQLMRNPESFMIISKEIISQLQFSYYKIHPQHNFIESISSACLSSSRILSNQANEVIKILSSHISPTIFPFNNKSIIPYFSTVEVTTKTVEVALESLKRNYPLSSRISIFSFITRALLKNSKLFNANLFIQKYLIPTSQYQFIYCLLNLENINLEPIISSLKNLNTTPIIFALKVKLKLAKFRDFDIVSFYTKNNCKDLLQEEIYCFSDLLLQIRNESPDFSAKYFVLFSEYTKHNKIILKTFDKALINAPNEFIDSLFNIFLNRTPNDLIKFVPILQKYYKSLSSKQLAIAIALGVDILEEVNERIINILFSLLKKNNWTNNVEKAIIKLIKFPNLHKAISNFVIDYINDETYFNIISNIFLNFDYEIDKNLFNNVFNEPNKNQKLIEICLSMKSYIQFPIMLTQLLIHNENIAKFSRKFYFSFLPKLNKFTVFDFLLFLSFYPKLLKSQTFDEISQNISQLLCKFEFVEYSKLKIINILEKVEDSDEILAHLYASDKLNEVNEMHIAHRILYSEKCAKCFDKEMENYGDIFHEKIISIALTRHQIYKDFLPNFSSYLYNLMTLNCNDDIYVKCISNTIYNYYNKISKEEIIDTLFQKLNNKPTVLQLVIQNLTSIGNKNQVIYDFIINLKPNQLIPNAFNTIVEKFLLQTHSEAIIDKFLSQPQFAAMPKGTISSLLWALRSSKRTVKELFDQILTQCRPKISDEIIKYLISCVNILRQINKIEIQNISNSYVNNYEQKKKEHIALVFHFSNIPDKMKTLQQWLISDNEKTKDLALTILRYLFNIPSEAQHLNVLLKNLILTTPENDIKIIESTTNALRAAASSLNEDILTEIMPFFISLIKPEFSRSSFEAAISFLIVVETKYPLILLYYLHDLFSAIQGIRIENTNINSLFTLIESHLKQSNYPTLLQQIINLIRTHQNTLTIFECIEKNIEQTYNNESLTKITFSMIQNSFNSLDLQLKSISYKILSSFNLPDSLFEKSIDIFYNLCSESHRKELIIHFQNFLSKCTFERKDKVYKTFLKKAETTIKDYQSNGLSMLFGAILASINEKDYISDLIEFINTTNNTILRDTLMSSLIEMFELSSGAFSDKIISVTMCILVYADQSSKLSFRLLKQIINYVPNNKIDSFLDMLSNQLSSSSPDVREMCLSLIMTFLRSLNKFNDEHHKFTKTSFDKLSMSCYTLTFDNEPPIVKQANLLLPLLNINNYSYDVNYIDHFLLSKDERIKLIGISSILSLIKISIENNNNNYINIVEFWAKTSQEEFEKQFLLAYKTLISIDLRSIFSKQFLISNVDIPYTTKICKYFIYSFLDSSKNIKYIPETYQKWRENNPLLESFKFAEKTLSILFNISHGNYNPKPFLSSPQKPLFTTKTNRSSTGNIITEDVQQFSQECNDSFISLAILLRNESVINCFKSFSPRDQILLKLSVKISNINPEFFLKYAETYADRILMLLFSDIPNDSIRIIQESFVNLLMRLNSNQIKLLLDRITPFFLNFQPSQNNRKMFNDSFVSSIIMCLTNSIQDRQNQADINEALPLFIVSIFPYMSDIIRSKFADSLIFIFLNEIINGNKSNTLNLLIAMNHFEPYLSQHREIYITTTLATILSYPKIDTELRSEVLTSFDIALSLGLSSKYLLSIIIARINVGDTLLLLESIEFVLEFSKEKISSTFLIENVWNIIRCKRRDNDFLIKAKTLRIAALITNMLTDENSINIISDALPIDNDDPISFCSFLSGIKNIDKLRSDQISAIERHIGSAKVDYSCILPIIPLLFHCNSKSLIISCMSVLVRGINEGPYLAPKLCIEALSTLVEKLHNMDVKNSAMIVTGIYFAYCGLEGELRNKAGELLTAILGKPGQKMQFRETYFKELDASVLQALKRDFGF